MRWLLLAAVLLLSACAVRPPPAINESIRVIIVENRGRFVRSQALLQQELCDIMANRMGWRVSPLGTASLSLDIDPEQIDPIARDELGTPIRWQVNFKGTVTFATTGFDPVSTPLAGFAYISSRANEAEVLDDAAKTTARRIAAWLEKTVRDRERAGLMPKAAEPGKFTPHVITVPASP